MALTPERGLVMPGFVPLSQPGGALSSALLHGSPRADGVRAPRHREWGAPEARDRAEFPRGARGSRHRASARLLLAPFARPPATARPRPLGEACRPGEPGADLARPPLRAPRG